MKRSIIQFAFVFFIINPGFALAEDSTQADDKTLQSLQSAIKVSGGISAGHFYASNSGIDASEDEFLLSNFLVEFSSKAETQPVSFVAAFGETSTPSILSTPENNTHFKIEYASAAVKPVKDTLFEVGLLRPNSGFENTYTFNNKNVILGVIASRQPYNAYGVKVSHDVNGISLWGGYYKARLDEEEYDSPDFAWEIGLCGTIDENDVSIYNYRIKDRWNLFGAAIERTIEEINLAVNIDYWTWDKRGRSLYGSGSSIGVAVYISPNFGKLSIPVRLEYVNQNESQIYVESPTAKQIYAATVSPTWHFNENAYIRAESAYVKADGAFSDENGQTRDNRIHMAIELALLF